MPELDPNPTPLSRVELLRLAQGLGVVDADVMTRAELRAAIDKAQRPERPAHDQHSATWVSVARRLLASVVERGLNLPDAAALIRGDAKLMAPPKAPPPVATVTLARIYAAQGHLDRAIGTLDEVMRSDPDHELARDLRSQLELRRAEVALREGEVALRKDQTALRKDQTALREGAAAAPPPPDDRPAPDARLESSAPAFDDGVSSEPRVHEPLAPKPLPVASIDAAAEFVAPSFDTVEKQAAHADLPPFPSEPPTLVGAVSLEIEASAAPGGAAESEPPATLAAGVDWQIENDSAASTDASYAGDAPPWANGAGPASVVEHAAWIAAADAGENAHAEPDATAGVVPEPAFTAAHAGANNSGAAEAACAAETVETSARVAAAATAADSVSAADSLPEPPAGDPHAMNGVANGVAPARAFVPPAAAPEPLPSVPGLLLIETDTPIRYIYWELAAGEASSLHWIHVVTHTPTGRGDTERRERRFPVQRQLGALRLEGVPQQAVVRAKLTHAPDDARPLVVAGAVRPRSLGSSESFEVRYAPHGKAAPEALAGRARPLLERASAVYWDS